MLASDVDGVLSVLSVGGSPLLRFACRKSPLRISLLVLNPLSGTFATDRLVFSNWEELESKWVFV